MKDLSTATVAELIQQFENDIQFDCHPVERRVNFSDAKKELQRRGRKVLTEIGDHIVTKFPKGGFFDEDIAQQDFFLAWGYLLFGITRDHKLESSCPYTSKTPFGEQNMQHWAIFCHRQAA
jgi:hypothetical protein